MTEETTPPEPAGVAGTPAGLSGRHAVDPVRAAHHRLELLLEVSEALAGSLDPEEVLTALGRLLVPSQADHILVDLVREPGRASRRIVAGDDLAEVAAALEATAAPWPPDGTPAAVILAGGPPMLMADIPASLVAATAGDAARRRLAATMAPRSGVAVPLVGRERTLGAISLVLTASSGRRYGEDDLAFAVEVGRRAGLAIEVALLYQDAQAATRRTASLQALTASLASARTVDEVAALAVSSAGAAVGGGTSSLCLVTPEGDALELVASRGYAMSTSERWRRFPVDAPVPAVDAMSTGRPVVLRSLADRDDRYPVLAGAEASDRSYAVVPLLVDGAAIGALTVGFTEDGAPSEEDESLLVAISGQCAQAVQRARSREARLELADALQASLLPPALPAPAGLELAVRYRSLGGGVIGGDFYDVFSVDGGASWTIAIGDVCGKGPAAAAVTSLVRHTIRAVARTGASPAELLAACNDAILDAELGERFATIVVCSVRVDGGAAAVRLACGGHPPPVVRRRDGGLAEVAADGMAVGLFPDLRFHETPVRLEPGDDLILFTDGLLEARSPSGAFAPHLLDQVLRATAGALADETAAGLLAAIDAFEAGRARDDLALLVVRAPLLQVDRARVSVPGTPTALFIAGDDHLEELVRELELIRVGRRHGVSGTAYPQRLLTLLDDVLARHTGLRGTIRDQAELAAALGEASFTSELVAPAVGAVIFRQLSAVLDELEEHARSGALLTLAPPAAVSDARRAWMEAVASQLDGGAPHHVGDEAAFAPPRLTAEALPSTLDARHHAREVVAQGDAMARAARRFVVATLGRWAADDVVERLELPLSELVTNVQIHVRDEAEIIVVGDGATFRVEVHDRSEVPPAWRSHDRTAGTGRGLRLVESYVDRWGTHPTPSGKCVWVEVDRPAATSR